MDAWGPDECWKRIEEIVSHLREAAEKKGLPFIATAARIMVGRAIEAARAEATPATPPPG
jgi:ribosome biogenesis protein Tsr3